MTVRDCVDSRDGSIRPRLHAVCDTIRSAISEAEERLPWGQAHLPEGTHHFALSSAEELDRELLALCFRGSEAARALTREHTLIHTTEGGLRNSEIHTV